MTQVIVGKWGKNLAIRVPLEIARSAGLSDGEHVEVEQVEGNILIRRSAAQAQARADAKAAAAEIIAEARSYRLGEFSLRDLREDGRRG